MHMKQIYIYGNVLVFGFVIKKVKVAARNAWRTTFISKNIFIQSPIV